MLMGFVYFCPSKMGKKAHSGKKKKFERFYYLNIKWNVINGKGQSRNIEKNIRLIK